MRHIVLYCLVSKSLFELSIDVCGLGDPVKFVPSDLDGQRDYYPAGLRTIEALAAIYEELPGLV